MVPSYTCTSYYGAVSRLFEQLPVKIVPMRYSCNKSDLSGVDSQINNDVITA